MRPERSPAPPVVFRRRRARPRPLGVRDPSSPLPLQQHRNQDQPPPRALLLVPRATPSRDRGRWRRPERPRPRGSPRAAGTTRARRSIDHVGRNSPLCAIKEAGNDLLENVGHRTRLHEGSEDADHEPYDEKDECVLRGRLSGLRDEQGSDAIPGNLLRCAGFVPAATRISIQKADLRGGAHHSVRRRIVTVSPASMPHSSNAPKFTSSAAVYSSSGVYVGHGSFVHGSMSMI